VLFTVPSCKQPLTSALSSKASNLQYSLMRLPPPPPSPSPAKHTQLSYAGLRHSRGGVGPGPVDANPGVRECRARPGRPSMMDPSSVIDGRSEFIYKIPKVRKRSYSNTPCFTIHRAHPRMLFHYS
jgi:hypothetical protein